MVTLTWAVAGHQRNSYDSNCVGSVFWSLSSPLNQYIVFQFFNTLSFIETNVFHVSYDQAGYAPLGAHAHRRLLLRYWLRGGLRATSARRNNEDTFLKPPRSSTRNWQCYGWKSTTILWILEVSFEQRYILAKLTGLHEGARLLESM